MVRETLHRIGYDRAKYGFDAETCAVITAIDEQSADIAQGVDVAYEARTDPNDEDKLDRVGAGDQGMMFGYATRETRALMPMPIQIAHTLARRLAEVRKAEVIPYLRPDGKTQVTVRYENDRPAEIVKMLISTQHKPDIDGEALIKPDLWEHVVEPVLHEEYKELFTNNELYEAFLVNPTGKFEMGGPGADAGLTGRKIIVDTYGGAARHGGGAFSGKDPSKVDRSGAYAGRYVAKNVVAAGLAERCEVQVAYAIGVAHPVSLMANTFGTGKLRTPSSRADRARSSTFARRRSGATSTCTGRSSRRPRPTATSAATITTSPGSAPTASTRCARPRAWPGSRPGRATRPRSPSRWAPRARARRHRVPRGARRSSRLVDLVDHVLRARRRRRR